MKSIKRIAVFFLLMIILSGCAEKQENKIQKVKVWTPNFHSKAVMTDIVDEWNKTRGKEIGIEISYEVREGSIQTNMEAAFATGDGPDLYSSAMIERNIALENIIAIEDIKGGKEWIEEYDQDIIKSPEYRGKDGKVYLLPSTVTTFGLIYNKDMFRKYGIVDEFGEPTPPETFEEVREYAKRMTNLKERDYGIIIPMRWESFYSIDVRNLLASSVGHIGYDPQKDEFNYDGLKPIWGMYMGIKEDKSYFPHAEELDNDPARAYFAEKNIGMKFAASYDVGVFNSQFLAKCDWGVAPLPVANKDERHPQYMLLNAGLAISGKTVERIGDEKALEVLKFFYSDEVARKLYQKGMSLYFDSSVTENVKIDKGLTGWKEFADFVDISSSNYYTASADLGNEKGHEKVFMEDVWTNKITVDEAINKINKTYNEGYKEKQQGTQKD